MTSSTILVVDDDAQLRRFLKTTLTGPPSVATKSNSLSILSSTSSEAAMTNTPSIGISTSRKI